MSNNRKPIFIKLLTGSTIIIVLGFWMYSSTSKSKTEHVMVKGKIDFIDKSFEKYHPIDNRFIHLEGNDRVFDIFIGKKTGDFSPEFEQLDQLHLGDEIVVYHSETLLMQKDRLDPRINRNVEYIDKANKTYYIRGNRKWSARFFIFFGVLLLIMTIALKSFKKIE
ncbi:hypothetical protein [Flavobacterium sp.]|uniref:hypothetical protein n=1 Tax=Flavobacterium sp. TaxID=239 RepID=UPI00286C935D|nr:hypothetical protein [Flavobacterium sp.]